MNTNKLLYEVYLPAGSEKSNAYPQIFRYTHKSNYLHKVSQSVEYETYLLIYISLMPVHNDTQGIIQIIFVL